MTPRCCADTGEPGAVSAPQRRRSTPRARNLRAQLERGSASESVIIVPAVLMLIFLIIQLGLWGSARSVAAHSAREGATAEALYQSTSSASQVTNAALADNAGGLLRDYHVSTSRTGQTITVTVTGKSLSLVPFYSPTITQSATVPIEQYVP